MQYIEYRPIVDACANITHSPQVKLFGNNSGTYLSIKTSNVSNVNKQT